MPRQRPANGLHEVAENEWVGSIARSYGFTDWLERVWRHAENSELREKRGGSPYRLAAGDRLFIPELAERTETVACEQRHRFRVRRGAQRLRLRIIDVDGTPLADEDYVLEVEVPPGSPPFVQANQKTDADAFVDEELPLGTTNARITLPASGSAIDMAIGRLDPLDPDDPATLRRAAQQRLRSLGFYSGPVDGAESEETAASIRSFQAFCASEENREADSERVVDAGPVDGTLSAETIEALRTMHGS